MFSPAMRAWPGKNWSYTIYMIYCAHGWVMCTRTSDEACPATMDGGGRDGAAAFSARGQRTGMNKARRSITGVWGCISRTQFGQRRGGGWWSTAGRLGFLTAAMAARRSIGWDAGGWQGSSRGAFTGWCGAAGALGRVEEALYRRVDGEAERAAELELTGAAGNVARVQENGIRWVDEL
jgi:hypothetical protein